MSKYIDMEYTLEIMNEVSRNIGFVTPADAIEVMMKIVKSQSIIDAVPVVRCKDCDLWDKQRPLHGEISGNKRCLCKAFSDESGSEDGARFTKFDDFCSYGKQRNRIKWSEYKHSELYKSKPEDILRMALELIELYRVRKIGADENWRKKNHDKQGCR